jgi:hypothetical protein
MGGQCTAQPIFEAGPVIRWDSGAWPWWSNMEAVSIGDYDHDGLGDVAVGLGGESSFYYGVVTPPAVLIIPSGTMAPAYLILPVSPDAGWVVTVASGQVMGSGDDLVVSFEPGFRLIVWNGDAGFVTSGPYLPSAPSAYLAAVGDLDGDGLGDVVLVDAVQGLEIFYSHGDGGFTEVDGQPPELLVLPGGVSFGGVAVGDLDGDGIADLALSYDWKGDSWIGVLLRDQDGGLHLAASASTGPLYSGNYYPVPVVAGGLATAVDGYIDLFALVGKAQLLLLASTPEVIAGYCAVGGDFNGDSLPDLVQGGYAIDDNGALSVWIGHDGGYGQPGVAEGAFETINTTIAAGDLNGDGRPDLAVIVEDFGNGGLTSVQVFYNNCSPSPP